MRTYLIIMTLWFYSCQTNSESGIQVKNKSTEPHAQKETILTKCQPIIKDNEYLYRIINPDVASKNLSTIFTDTFFTEKIAHKNFHGDNTMDTIYRIRYKTSYIEMEKSSDARQAKDPYSNWRLARIQNPKVVLSNGLYVGISRAKVAALLNHHVAACDTVIINDDELTYRNYLVMRNDTVREINLAISGD